MGRVAWRRRIALSVHVAPLGLGCALLLYGVALGVYEGLEYLNPLRPNSQPLPMSEVERALTDVQASMLELPGAGEARAVAELAGNARMVLLENRQLASTVHRLEAQYASLVSRFEATFAGQKESVDLMRSEFGRFRDRQDAIATQVGRLLERDFAVALKQSEAALHKEARHPSGTASKAKRLSNQSSLGSDSGDSFVADASAARSWVSNTALRAEPSVRFAALLVARRLDNGRREALLSKREQTFTINVESGLLGETSEGELLQLDPAFEIGLDTASSEVIDERSGRIRFFPDGSSTGGRIHLQGDEAGATVSVDWSTGAVTVQVHNE